MKLCPICTEKIALFEKATGRTVKINNVEYHISCIGEMKIKEVEVAGWIKRAKEKIGEKR